MKLLKLLKYLLYLLIAVSVFSCQEDKSQEKRLLDNAINNLAINRPEVSLDLLASIRNPRNMDQYNYMQYIVTYVGAKYELGEDITSDTLIFEAQKYFEKKGPLEEEVLANFYTAQLYNANNLYPQALELFMYTIVQARESGDELFIGRSYNNIGYIYYEQSIIDSAIINYQKALLHYDKVENSDKRKLRTLTYIGSAYTIEEKFDSAFLYFNKCLTLAKETENETYQFYSLKNLGVVSYGMQEYDKAIEYFQSALTMDSSDEVEIRKAYLYLLNIYNKKQDPKSAKEYVDLVIASLPEVTYNYTLKEMYAALAEYYKQLGDYKQALDYSELERATKDQIEKEANAPALLQADKNFHLAQKDREAAQLRTHLYLYLSIIAIIIFIVLLFLLFLWKEHKKNKEEIKLHTEKYEIIRGMLHSMNQRYPHIEAEIKSMLEDNEEDKK